MQNRIFKRINLLYLNQFLRGLGYSLVGIFIPIYFLILGFSLTSVLVYFLIFHIITFIFVPTSLLLSKKFGYKSIIITGVMFNISFLILLQFLEMTSSLIYLISVLGGIGNAFYFIPFHAFFTRFSDKDKRGTQFSNYVSLGKISGLFGPLVGASIAIFFGFTSLFYIAIFFILLSLYPLIKLKDVKPTTKLSFSGIKNLTKRNKRFFLGTIADDIKGEVEGIIWPIFIYFALGSLISVGFVKLIISVGAITFTLFVGRFYDTRSKYFFLKLGGLLYAVVWFSRIYFEGQISLYVLSLMAGFLIIMIDIPFNAIFYEKASGEKDSDEFIVFREIPTVIGRSFLWILMILLINKFVVAFVLAGLASLVFVFFKFGLKKD